MLPSRTRKQYPKTSGAVIVFQDWLAGRIKRAPDGFWQEPENCRAVLEWALAQDGHTLDDAPIVLCRKWFHRNRLLTLSGTYRNSPYYLLTELYPGRYEPGQFREMPKAVDLQNDAFGGERPEEDFKRRHRSRVMRADTQGLCMHCNSPRMEGSRYCARHAELNKQRQREQYHRWRAEGICFRCGSAPAEEQGMCLPCYRKYRAVRNRRYRKLYARKKAAGLCAYKYCTNKPVAGSAYCEKHLSEQRQRYYRLDYRQKAREYRERKQQPNKN